jgi:hypothetical protein
VTAASLPGALDPEWFLFETRQQSETLSAQVSGPGWSEIRSCTYVPTWPQCGQVRLAIVPHRIGSEMSVGGVASAKGIGSPQPAQSTTRYHFLAGAIFTMAYQCLRYTNITNGAPRKNYRAEYLGPQANDAVEDGELFES